MKEYYIIHDDDRSGVTFDRNFYDIDRYCIENQINIEYDYDHALATTYRGTQHILLFRTEFKPEDLTYLSLKYNIRPVSEFYERNDDDPDDWRTSQKFRTDITMLPEDYFNEENIQD
jgi:hypothetical protein